jgi:hypothetical protein
MVLETIFCCDIDFYLRNHVGTKARSLSLQVNGKLNKKWNPDSFQTYSSKDVV